MKINRFYKVSLLVYIALAGSAFADDGWVNIGVSEKNAVRYDIKKSSLEITKTKADIPIAVVIGRITTPKTSNVSVYKWYVSLQDCVNELGKVVSLDMAGDYQFENDFVFGGGNMAAAMGEMICGAAQSRFSENEKKGL